MINTLLKPANSEPPTIEFLTPLKNNLSLIYEDLVIDSLIIRNLIQLTYKTKARSTSIFKVRFSSYFDAYTFHHAPLVPSIEAVIGKSMADLQDEFNDFKMQSRNNKKTVEYFRNIVIDLFHGVTATKGRSMHLSKPDGYFHISCECESVPGYPIHMDFAFRMKEIGIKAITHEDAVKWAFESCSTWVRGKRTEKTPLIINSKYFDLITQVVSANQRRWHDLELISSGAVK